MTYDKALQFATEAHEGQFRKFSREPYIVHPTAVAEAVERKCREDEMCEEDIEAYKITAVLHDTVEDTSVTLDQIEELFGPRVRIAVDHLTRREGEAYVDFILRSRHNAIARVVKSADLSHNLEDLHQGSMHDKYQLALQLLQGRIKLSELL
jgi:(p)ppGpp synthase/HD superfamily hydrolase